MKYTFNNRNFNIKLGKNAKWVLLGLGIVILMVIIFSCSNRSNNTQSLTNAGLSSFGTLSPTSVPTPSPTSSLLLTDPQQGDGTGAGVGVDGGAVVSTSTSVPTAAPTAVLTAAPTATPSTSVRIGDTGDKVKSIQQRLKDLKYYTGSVDGDFGSGTESAVKAFQKAHGLTADGVVGERTLAKLNSSDAKTNTSSSSSSSSSNTSKATSVPSKKEYTPSELKNYRFLQLGSSGSDVKKLQNRLIELGYMSGTASGTYDEITEAAVEAFQARNGEWVDGVAGEDTQTKLYSSSALAAPKD